MPSISDYINAHVTNPTVGVKISGVWQNAVLGIEWDRSFDQNSATCTITFGQALALTPDNFTPVVVYLGYNTYSVAVFTGYVDEYGAGLNPKTWVIKCRDVLKKAEDVWLNDVATTYTSTQAESAVSDLLSKAGLGVTAGTTSFTIGDIHPVDFKLTSIIEACQQIANLIGWHIWAGADGTVYFNKLKPKQSDATATWTYQYGLNILKRNFYKTDKELRNSIVVLGYYNPNTQTPIRSAVRADSPYTNIDRVAILSSELVDTQSMSDTIATWMITDLNSLTWVYELDCVGNPLIDVGRTIRITDTDYGLDANFFVFSLHGSIDQSSGAFTNHIVAVRWETSNANLEWQPPPAPPSPPPGPIVPPIVPPPAPTGIPPGKGNLLYVSSLRGLAKCINAYGTDGTDGAPIWSSLSATINYNTSGTITQAAYTVTGSGTAFLTEVAVGDRIKSTSIDGNVTLITSDTVLTLDTTAAAPTPATYSIYRPFTGLSAAALTIRSFNLDPASLIDSVFTRGWAMTDDGLYRVDGLPNAPVWTKKLSVADATTLIGTGGGALSGHGLCWTFTPSVLKPNFIATVGYAQRTPSGYFGANEYDCFFIWSTDAGATWNCNNTYHVKTILVPKTLIQLFASYHVADTFFMAGNTGLRGTETYTGYAYGISPGIFLLRCTSLTAPQFLPISSITEQVDAYVVMPYKDGSGVVYANDERMYLYGTGLGTQSSAIRKLTSGLTPPWAPSYTPHSSTSVGDSTMTAGNPYNLTQKPFFHTFSENHAYSLGLDNSDVKDKVWFSPDGATTWTRQTPGNGQLTATDLFPIPADRNIAYITGRGSSGQEARVQFTKDFGATWTRIDNPGATSLDGVLGLSAGDMVSSQIMIDYWAVGTTTPVSGGTGIDVSHWQGTMNWVTAAAAGITFAFIKCTDGTTGTDANFAANWSGALAQGIQRGAYHYFRNNLDPATQASHFLAVYAAAGGAGELHMALDCEDEATSVTAANIKTFLDAIEASLGYKPTIYTRASWWNNTRFGGPVSWANQYPLWVAHWGATAPSIPTDWTTFAVWQYSGSGVGATYGASSTAIDLDKVG